MYASRSLKVKEIVVYFEIDVDITERERVDTNEILSKVNITIDLSNVLPANSSVNMVQHTTKGSCVFRVHGDITQKYVVITWHVFPMMHVHSTAI
jgi:hypothetical protein